MVPCVRPAQIALWAEVVQVPREAGEGARVVAIRWAVEIRAVCRDVDLEGVARLRNGVSKPFHGAVRAQPEQRVFVIAGAGERHCRSVVDAGRCCHSIH